MTPHDTTARSVLRFVVLAERLKSVLRHSWLSSGRRESVAEHTWMMALMAIVTHRHLEHPVDLDRALRMIVVHDLVEAEVGDVPFFDTSDRKREKVAREQAAIARIRDMLDPATGNEVHDLFQEFEARTSPESRFVKALDDLEVQAQHNLADFSTWEPVEYALVYTKMQATCAHDGFLRALSAAIQDDAEALMTQGGVDVAAVRSSTA